MDTETIARRLGLPKHSGTIFEALERRGHATPTELSHASRLHRPAVYRALNALIRHGFVFARREGKHIVYLTHGRMRILRAFAHAARKFRTATRTLPAEKSLGMVTYLEGDSSIKTVFDDVVSHSKKGDVFYRYTSERDLDQVNAHLSVTYRTRRDAKRLERLVISNPQSAGRKRKRLERFIKHLGGGKEAFDQNAIQLIYGSRIAFIDLNTNRGLIINNPTLAEFQKTIFRALYRRL